MFYILGIHEARMMREVEICSCFFISEMRSVLRKVEEGWVEQAFPKANLVVLECFTANFTVGLGISVLIGG